MSVSHKKIVWIASYPKSGNTWVRCFLDAYFVGEVNINDLVCSVSDDAANRYQIGDGSDIKQLPIELQMLARPMALLRLVRTFICNKFADVPLFVKTHVPHMVANGVELLPEALTHATVYIVRNPMEVLPSYAKHMGKNLDESLTFMNDKYRTLTSKTAPCVDELISSWDEHAKSYQQADTHNVMVVRYEDLKADPVKWFSAILTHSGVTPNPDRVAKAIEMVELGKLQAQEKAGGFVESSPYAKDQFFGGTNHTLPGFIQYRITKMFGRTMKKFGYLDNKKAAA